ncbi:uncharacterized protein LOC126055353 [Helicoverpa armigera]|uniref:uncharacterized protein LOC126055353 n=1 Tax=Helicoverpa armigera TaxID=29058 RepID=UPI0030836A27
MDSETTTAAAGLLCALAIYSYAIKKKQTIQKKQRKRRWWITTIHRNRTSATMEEQLNELVAEPTDEFKKFSRMSLNDFEYLLSQISTRISKQDTQLRKAIPAQIRLAITLRYLATGDDFESLHFLFKVSPQIISKIIPEVCHALCEVLEDEIKIPSCPEEWLRIERGFARKFPRAVGSIDGKHIVLDCPFNSGSVYYNYKRTYSIVLLALVDSQYNFMFADIGCQGRISDGGVFTNSILWNKMCTNSLNLPPPHPLPGSNIDVPYVFLGDGAFALSEHLMKPYPDQHNIGSAKREFNKRLSSARVVVENTFGILAARFRVFRKPIPLQPQRLAL